MTVRYALLLVVVVASVALQGSSMLRQECYGSLYQNDSSPVDITITDAGTYYQWVATTVGECAGLTGSTSTDSLTVPTGGGGDYNVSFNVCFQGTTNTVYTWRVLKGGSATVIGANRKIGASSDVGSAGGSGIIALAAGDVLTLGVTADGASKTAST